MITTSRRPTSAPASSSTTTPAKTPPTTTTTTTSTTSTTSTTTAGASDHFTRGVVARSAALVAGVGAPTLSTISAVRGLSTTPLPARSLPPLAEAMVDDVAFPAISPATLPVPAEVLAALTSAKKILVVGHTPPDGDCVGAALGLRTLLEGLGKTADACVDAPLPGRLAGLDEQRTLKRANELDDDYDLVVLVDVAQGARIGGALAAVQRSPNVMVIDHHHAEGTLDEATKGQPGDTGQAFTRWIEPHIASASLLVASVAEHLGREVGMPSSTWEAMSVPLAAGTLTDTDHFRLPGASAQTLGMFKHLVQHHLGGALGKATAPLDYTFPPTATAMLTPMPGGAVQARRVGDSVVVSASQAGLDAVLDTARQTAPRTDLVDVHGTLMDQLDRQAQAQQLAVLVFEEAGQVRVSVRSKAGDDAVDLVNALFPGRGGGKPHVAAARPEGTLGEVQQQVQSYLRAHQQDTSWQLRVGRG